MINESHVFVKKNVYMHWKLFLGIFLVFTFRRQKSEYFEIVQYQQQ